MTERGPVVLDLFGERPCGVCAADGGREGGVGGGAGAEGEKGRELATEGRSRARRYDDRK